MRKEEISTLSIKKKVKSDSDEDEMSLLYCVSHFVVGGLNLFAVKIIFFGGSIVFVWSQYDGGNIDKEQLAEVPSKT